jgi:predicted dinucleotide-binding enzyme
VISIRAVSTNRSAHLHAGRELRHGRMLVVDDADARATVSAFADSLGFAPVDLGQTVRAHQRIVEPAAS